MLKQFLTERNIFGWKREFGFPLRASNIYSVNACVHNITQVLSMCHLRINPDFHESCYSRCQSRLGLGLYMDLALGSAWDGHVHSSDLPSTEHQQLLALLLATARIEVLKCYDNDILNDTTSSDCQVTEQIGTLSSQPIMQSSDEASQWPSSHELRSGESHSPAPRSTASRVCDACIR